MIWAAITGNLWRAAAAGALAIAAALALWIFGLPVIGGGLLAKVDRLTTLNAANVASHRKTKENFRAAMADAQRREVFRLARVRAEFERNNERAQERFNDRIALLRSRYDSLRAKARAGSTGAAGSVEMSTLPVPAFGTDAEADTDRLLAEQLECSTIALQLDELILWIKAQTKVKVND